jgi:hypothetical protein
LADPGSEAVTEQVEEHGLGLVFRLQKILSPLRSIQKPGIEASRLFILKQAALPSLFSKGAASADLEGSDKDASWQTIYVVPRLARLSQERIKR